MSLAFAIFSELALKVTFSQSARCTVSPFRATSPLPFFTRISCESLFGSFRTMAALSGAREARAPATMTCDFEPSEYVAVDRSTVPVLTATATLVCCCSLRRACFSFSIPSRGIVQSPALPFQKTSKTVKPFLICNIYGGKNQEQLWVLCPAGPQIRVQVFSF